MVKIALPRIIETVIQKLNIAGYKAYAVGGCVRDSLMGKVPTDWDITTSATPAEMQTVFADYKTVETGLKHGTLTVITDDMPIEITTYRLDGDYSDGRHPDAVTFSRCLSEDLCRRDFTINAMAYHHTEALVDLYEGQNDLHRKTIRCVGDAQRRFSEDALRILRALRFASVLGFEIEQRSEEVLRQLSPTLTRVSTERITIELGKLICGQNAHIILNRYTDVLSVVLPFIDLSAEYTLLSSVPATPIARWAALFLSAHVSANRAAHEMRRLRLDKHTIQAVKQLLEATDMPYHTESDLLRILSCLGANNIGDYLSLRQADDTTRMQVHQLLSEHRCYNVSMLAINGNDLLNAGVISGPDVGAILAELLDAVIEGRCPNDKEHLLQYVMTLKKPVQ